MDPQEAERGLHRRPRTRSEALAGAECRRATEEPKTQGPGLRRTQTALVESDTRYRHLYDLAPVAYVTLGREGDIQETNPMAAALLGAERTRLLGRPLADFVSPGDRALLRNHLRRCFEAVARVNNEIRIGAPRREEIITDVISVPICAPNGETVGCRTTLADISRLKRWEERTTLLARASLLLAAPLVDDVPCDDVIRLLVPAFADVAALDLLDEHGQLRPVALAAETAALERRAAAAAANPRWAAGGIPPAFVGGEPLLLADCSLPALVSHGLEEEPILRACGATSALILPVRSRTADFGLLTLAATNRRRRFDAIPDCTIAQDLAARLALALHNARLYREARGAVTAREEVLAFVAHELRNPVHAISLALGALLDEAPQRERRRGWQRLDRVRLTADQMNRMIDDLLDLSSVDAGRLTIATAECNVADVIQDANDALGPLVHDKGIHLNVELTAGSGRMLCDPTRVLQVFSNLVGNAVKFTRRGGTITVRARADGDVIAFSLADTGDGIAQKHLSRLFDRYWQADERSHKGRGLGLYIARRIVEAQGGRIWAESQPGIGTTIHFTLPRPRHD